MKKPIVLIFSILIFVSCASSHILVGTPRVPIDPSKVKIYIDPPAKYEKVAIIEASSKNSWTFTDQGKMSKVVERLKNEAAALGANGILFEGAEEKTGAVVGVAPAFQPAGVGMAFAAPAYFKSGKGIAIYIEE